MLRTAPVGNSQRTLVALPASWSLDISKGLAIALLLALIALERSGLMIPGYGNGDAGSRINDPDSAFILGIALGRTYTWLWHPLPWCRLSCIFAVISRLTISKVLFFYLYQAQSIQNFFTSLLKWESRWVDGRTAVG